MKSRGKQKDIFYSESQDLVMCRQVYVLIQSHSTEMVVHIHDYDYDIALICRKFHL